MIVKCLLWGCTVKNFQDFILKTYYDGYLSTSYLHTYFVCLIFSYVLPWVICFINLEVCVLINKFSLFSFTHYFSHYIRFSQNCFGGPMNGFSPLLQRLIGFNYRPLLIPVSPAQSSGQTLVFIGIF